jgi:hypothetical protein
VCWYIVTGIVVIPLCWGGGGANIPRKVTLFGSLMLKVLTLQSFGIPLTRCNIPKVSTVQYPRIIDKTKNSILMQYYQ